MPLYHVMAAQDYMDANVPTKGFLTNLRYMFDLRDVVIDVQGTSFSAGKCSLCSGHLGAGKHSDTASFHAY